MFGLTRVRCMLFCLVAALVAPGCSTTGKVTLNSVRPAAITFPSDVERLVIVERTDRGRPHRRFESIVSGELPGEDEAGTQALVGELRESLRASGRFDVVVAREMPPGLSLTSAFPRPLAWGRVSALCEAYDADAALVIEIFDTDFAVTRGMRVREGEGDSGKTVEYVAEGIAHVSVGIRVYDPSRRQLVDEKLFTRTDTWDARGATVRDALLALIDKSEATRHLSAQVGSLYAQRITPTPIRITRSFRGSYKKVPAVEQGTRYAEVGDWHRAKEVWEAGLNTADHEGAGYLSYNIALALEVIGDLPAARSWAERSYTQYGNRDARDYVSYLKRRQSDEALAEEQYE